MSGSVVVRFKENGGSQERVIIPGTVESVAIVPGLSTGPVNLLHFSSHTLQLSNQNSM